HPSREFASNGQEPRIAALDQPTHNLPANRITEFDGKDVLPPAESTQRLAPASARSNESVGQSKNVRCTRSRVPQNNRRALRLRCPYPSAFSCGPDPRTGKLIPSFHLREFLCPTPRPAGRPPTAICSSAFSPCRWISSRATP